MSTFATGRDALSVLLDFLQSEIDTTHAEAFWGKYGPPLLVASDDTTPNPNEAPRRERSSMAVARVERDVMRPMGLVSSVYDCTLRLEVKGNELTGDRQSGADKGTSVLLRTLTDIVDSNARALKDMGFGAITCEGGLDQTRSVRGAAQENNKTLRVSFYYLRPQRG